MTKQEFKKAIENGHTLYWCGNAGELIEHKPTDEYSVHKYIQSGENTVDDLYDNYWFDNRAEAEHYLYHANVTRKETLPFVTWEEFKNGKSINFVCRYGLEYILKEKYGSILLIWVNANSCIASWDLTEQNFYKAYDECVRLFKGEE